VSGTADRPSSQAVTGFEPAGSRAPEPKGTESTASEPTASEPTVSEPTVSEPAASGAAGPAEATGAAGPAEATGAAGPAPEPPAGRPADWLLVLWLSALSGWAALLGIAYLPLYLGSIPLPISAAIGAAIMWWAPRTCYRLTGSMPAAVLPAAVWFTVSVWLVLARNPIMTGVPLTVVAGQWRVMVLLGLGSLAAAASVGMVWGDRLRDKLATQRRSGGG